MWESALLAIISLKLFSDSVGGTHLGFGEHTALNCGENHNSLIRQTIGTFDPKEAIVIRIVFFVVGDKKVSGAYR